MKNKENKSKNDKPKKEISEGMIIFGTVLIIMLIFVSIGAFLHAKVNPKLQTETSNGFVFTKSGISWYTDMVSQEYNAQITANFRYAPSEVKEIPVTGDVRLFFASKGNMSYFTFNPTDNLTYMNLAAADLAKYLKVLNGVTLEAACTQNVSSACVDRPIISCESEKKIPVIYVRNSAISSVEMNGNCLTIQGSGEGLLKAYNKVLFLWYGIL